MLWIFTIPEFSDTSKENSECFDFCRGVTKFQFTQSIIFRHNSALIAVAYKDWPARSSDLNPRFLHLVYLRGQRLRYFPHISRLLEERYLEEWITIPKNVSVPRVHYSVPCTVTCYLHSNPLSIDLSVHNFHKS